MFTDVTDENNNLVTENNGCFYPVEKRKLAGNLCFIDNSINKAGLLLVKEGPTPAVHLKSKGGDFFIMSNTWGDNSVDSKICEEFILTELSLAKEMGLTCCQIDYGWQKGPIYNSAQEWVVREDFYTEDADFWSINPKRFPNGFQVVADKARELGIKMGLWFAPDASKDYINWLKDAETLSELYNKYGIAYFKLDCINLRSRKGEVNLLKMMSAVSEKTNRQAVFDLDVTAQVRMGYFGEIQYGNLFLENRNTECPTYFPHWTVRNLWILSKYFPAQRLQIEFLNVERNTHVYEEDPYAPAECGQEYAFAVTMFSNPLAWMELSGLSGKLFNILKNLITKYRQYQQEILSGLILPIGDEPSGSGWTGFQSIKNDKEGYLLFIRERNEREENEFQLWEIRNSTVKLEYILGSKENRLNAAENDCIRKIGKYGKIEVRLEKMFSYILYKYMLSGGHYEI